MTTGGMRRDDGCVAAPLLRGEVASALDDLQPTRVSVSRGLLLGLAGEEVGVQTGDLRVVVEVVVPAARPDPRVFLARIGEAFNILGQRSVPRGLALALAVPPFLLEAGPQTFTVVLRVGPAERSIHAVRSAHEGGRWQNGFGHTQSHRHGRWPQELHHSPAAAE
jgi:hypothetical protein